MNIILHKPKKSEKQLELDKKVATVHMQAVIDYVKSMSCPSTQKIELIEIVSVLHKKENGA